MLHINFPQLAQGLARALTTIAKDLASLEADLVPKAQHGTALATQILVSIQDLGHQMLTANPGQQADLINQGITLVINDLMAMGVPIPPGLAITLEAAVTAAFALYSSVQPLLGGPPAGSAAAEAPANV